MKYVNAPVMKKDAMALVTGKPVYMDDVAPKDCLIVKVLRSPHAEVSEKEHPDSEYIFLQDNGKLYTCLLYTSRCV